MSPPRRLRRSDVCQARGRGWLLGLVAMLGLVATLELVVLPLTSTGEHLGARRAEQRGRRYARLRVPGKCVGACSRPDPRAARGQIADHKGFSRLHVTPQTDLHIYGLAMDKARRLLPAGRRSCVSRPQRTRC